jgi:DMSO/TMAO reductase YedYZ molybdopterin-dependent catalytic subunit
MLTPWVNIALLALILLQAVTGYLGMTSNRPPEAWLLWSHGIGAYGLLLLMLLKGGIILDAWRRKKRWTGRRWGFLILLLLLILTTVLGLIWTFGGPIYLGGFSLVSLHIYIAVPVLILMLWHAWHMRFIWRLPEATGRRLFIGSAAAAMGGFLAWGAADRVKAWQGWPGALRRFTGSYETGSFTGQFPSVSWIADRPAPVDVDTWRLRVEGLVERPFSLTYSDLTALPQVEVEAALDCTGGWYTVQRWRGIRVGDLLASAGLSDEAASVTFEAVSGYKRRFDRAAAADYVLALGVVTTLPGSGLAEGIYRPLGHGNGYPLRLVAPDERGVEWVKWLGAIRANATGPNWQLPLPLQ